MNYLHGIKVPMIFINSLDDPLLSDILQSPVREFAGMPEARFQSILMQNYLRPAVP